MGSIQTAVSTTSPTDCQIPSTGKKKKKNSLTTRVGRVERNYLIISLLAVITELWAVRPRPAHSSVCFSVEK